MKYLNTISSWYGRLGNNIQQICNGIMFSKVNGHGFFSPPHEFINQIFFNFNLKDKHIINQNRFFFNKKDFVLPEDYIYENINKIAKEYIKFKDSKLDEEFDAETLVIHIRSGDIFQCIHKIHGYIPNPLCYYLNLIKKYKKTIIVTEKDNFNPVVNELRKNKEIIFHTKSVKEDFEVLMKAKNLASSGVGTFAIAAALCSTSIKNFYCTNLYLKEHINPEMLIHNDVKVNKINLKNYLKYWENNEEQRKFLLEYDLSII